jgi:hypothetical protein
MNDNRAAGGPNYTQPATFHFIRYESLNHSCGSPLRICFPSQSILIEIYGDTIASDSDSTETLGDLPDKLCQWHETTITIKNDNCIYVLIIAVLFRKP